MKRVLLALALLPTLSAHAFAIGSDSANVEINATVDASCVFDGAGATPASFSYTPAEGSQNEEAGAVSLYCNGVQGVILRSPPPETPVTLRRFGGGENDILQAKATVTQGEPTPSTNDLFEGATERVFTVNASADPGQWSAPAGSYVGVVTIEVQFY